MLKKQMRHKPALRELTIYLIDERQFKKNKGVKGVKEIRICKYAFDIRIILSWRQLKSSKQKKLPLFYLKAEYKFTVYRRQKDFYQPRDGIRGIGKISYSTSFLPYVYLPTVCHPWRSRTNFLCPVISLQRCCSLLKLLYKLNSKLPFCVTLFRFLLHDVCWMLINWFVVVVFPLVHLSCCWRVPVENRKWVEVVLHSG